MSSLFYKKLDKLHFLEGGQVGGQVGGQADKKNGCINRMTKENSAIIVANLSVSHKYIRNKIQRRQN